MTKFRPCPHGPRSPAPTASPPVSPSMRATPPVPGPLRLPPSSPGASAGLSPPQLAKLSLQVALHRWPHSSLCSGGSFPSLTVPTQFSTCHTSHNLRLPCFGFVSLCFWVSPRACKCEEWALSVPSDPAPGHWACHLRVWQGRRQAEVSGVPGRMRGVRRETQALLGGA